LQRLLPWSQAGSNRRPPACKAAPQKTLKRPKSQGSRAIRAHQATAPIIRICAELTGVKALVPKPDRVVDAASAHRRQVSSRPTHACSWGGCERAPRSPNGACCSSERPRGGPVLRRSHLAKANVAARGSDAQPSRRRRARHCVRAVLNPRRLTPRFLTGHRSREARRHPEASPRLSLAWRTGRVAGGQSDPRRRCTGWTRSWVARRVGLTRRILGGIGPGHRCRLPQSRLL
jgi:hypothetical protein